MAMLGSAGEQFSGIVFSRLDAALAKVQGSSIVFYACAFTMVASLLLGGGTRGGFLSDAILELLAIPAFMLVASSLIRLPWASTDIWYRAQWPLTLCLAIALLPLCQLVPLPPWIWTRLPGREAVAATFDLLGGRRPWMPISVSPTLTWLSVLSLLAPVTIFLGTIQLGRRERRNLSLIIVALGIVSAFLGLVQIAQGPASPLRFFAFTNDTEAVGFFANRNHFAALLYAVLLFAGAWAIDIAFKAGSLRDARNNERATILALAMILMVLVVLIAGEAMARSRAGLILTMIALAAIFALAFADGRNALAALPGNLPRAAPGKLVLGATILAVMLVVQFALYRIQDRFPADPLADARIPFAHNTVRAALAFMPFGAGVGTFVPVYGMFEKASDTFANIYANHAHDDFLEGWLETGVIGLALIASFGIWAGRRSIEVWRPRASADSDLDPSLGRAATIVIGLVLAHSFVDYPLRTGAMMAVFAFSCALLVEPLGGAENPVKKVELRPHPVPRKTVENSARMGTSARASPSLAPTPARATETSPPPSVARHPSPQQGGRWGEDIDWPEEWRQANGQQGSAKGNAQPKTKG